MNDLLQQTHDDLVELRKWFAAVPRQKFNMSEWTGDYDPEGSNENHSCLTAGCLWGWGAVYEPFKKRGVYLTSGGIPGYKGFVGYEAFAAFFGTPLKTAHYLCDPISYPGHWTREITAEEVLTRLDITIAQYETKLKQGAE